jgi:hypothetical protein
MKNSKGEKGYLPASYVKPAKWTVLADYPTEDPRMLRYATFYARTLKYVFFYLRVCHPLFFIFSVNAGDQLELVGQPSAGWVMAMRAEGEQGYVPYSYLSQGSGVV